MTSSSLSPNSIIFRYYFDPVPVCLPPGTTSIARESRDAVFLTLAGLRPEELENIGAVSRRGMRANTKDVTKKGRKKGIRGGDALKSIAAVLKFNLFTDALKIIIREGNRSLKCTLNLIRDDFVTLILYLKVAAF